MKKQRKANKSKRREREREGDTLESRKDLKHPKTYSKTLPQMNGPPQFRDAAMRDSAASSPNLAGDSVSEPTCGATVQSNATKTVAQRPNLAEAIAS